MKTIPLRELVRTPAKVKQWTHAGQAVRVTENGAPLWLVTPDPDAVDAAARRETIDEELADLLKTPRAKTSLSRLIKDSRQ